MQDYNFNNNRGGNRNNGQGGNNGYYQGGNRNNGQGGNNNPPKPDIIKDYSQQIKGWIEKGADKSMTDFAENVAAKYLGTGQDKLTRSKIRNIYGEIKRIQAAGWDKEKPSFYMLRPKVAYVVGREGNTDKVKVFQDIFNVASENVNSDKQYQHFCDLMEAIIAYHRVYSKD